MLLMGYFSDRTMGAKLYRFENSKSQSPALTAAEMFFASMENPKFVPSRRKQEIVACIRLFPRRAPILLIPFSICPLSFNDGADGKQDHLNNNKQ